MSLQQLVRPLVLVLAASVVAIYVAALRGDQMMSIVAAAAFAIAAGAVALVTNVGVWRQSAAGAPTDAEAAGPALRRNLRLIMLVYAWGALALFAAYPLAGLRWQHGWQYGLAMALIALGILRHVHLMEPGQPLREPKAVVAASWLTGLHAMAAMTGVAYVLFSGKLGTPKSDWVANHAFIAGGLAVAVIGALALMTTRKLMPAQDA